MAKTVDSCTPSLPFHKEKRLADDVPPDDSGTRSASDATRCLYEAVRGVIEDAEYGYRRGV